jgi:hypothetical protein
MANRDRDRGCTGLTLVVLVAGHALCCAGMAHLYSALADGSGRDFKVVPGRQAGAACWAQYDADGMQAPGWDTLAVVSAAGLPDAVQARACGFLEGYITQRRTWQNFVNMNYSRTLDPAVARFLDENAAWAAQQPRTDPYWAHVDLINEQVAAMARGYAAAAPPGEELTPLDFLIFNLDDDLGAIEEAVVPHKRPAWASMGPAQLFWELARREHCSAFIKVSPDLKDLYVAHNTWGSYPHSLRVMKSYRLAYSVSRSPGVLFSGYYGMLQSNDDIYLTEATRLAVTETTNSNLNDALYKLITPRSVMYWQRVLIANRLATNAREWVEIFGKWNSGTVCKLYHTHSLSHTYVHTQEVFFSPSLFFAHTS